MLSSKRDRFSWCKEDRVPEMSYFRLLHQQWHPTTRVVIVEERLESGRYSSARSIVAARQASAKPAWTPWLWVGS
jgi:hypothetical protein